MTDKEIKTHPKCRYCKAESIYSIICERSKEAVPVCRDHEFVVSYYNDLQIKKQSKKIERTLNKSMKLHKVPKIMWIILVGFTFLRIELSSAGSQYEKDIGTLLACICFILVYKNDD